MAAVGGGVIGALRVVLGADTAEFERGLKRSTVKLGLFAGAAVAAGHMLGQAMGKAIRDFVLAVPKAINEADKLGKMAQKIGVPVEQLSALKHAADLSGVSLESLSKGLGRLSRNMLEVASGTGGVAENAFKALNIQIRNTDGTLKTVSQILPEIADRFSKMRDGPEKTALAMQLLGRAGTDLIPMLNAGQAGLAAMIMEARELGIVIDTQTAKAAERFNDNLTRLVRVKDALVLQITSRMLPALDAFAQTLIDAANNGELMRTVAESIVSAIQVVATEIYVAVVGFQRFGAELSALWALLKSNNLEETKRAWAAFREEGEKTEKTLANIRGTVAKFWDEVSKRSQDAAKNLTGALKATSIAAGATGAAMLGLVTAYSLTIEKAEQQIFVLERELEAVGGTRREVEQSRIEYELLAQAKLLAAVASGTLTQAQEEEVQRIREAARQIADLRERIRDAKDEGVNASRARADAMREEIMVVRELGNSIGSIQFGSIGGFGINTSTGGQQFTLENPQNILVRRMQENLVNAAMSQFGSGGFTQNTGRGSAFNQFGRMSFTPNQQGLDFQQRNQLDSLLSGGMSLSDAAGKLPFEGQGLDLQRQLFQLQTAMSGDPLAELEFLERAIAELDKQPRTLERLKLIADLTKEMERLRGSVDDLNVGISDYYTRRPGQMFGFLGFSMGGVMSSRGSVPLRKYQMGGVANRAQLAMFGEGSQPEAYVPLPDGRTIPVTMNAKGLNDNGPSNVFNAPLIQFAAEPQVDEVRETAYMAIQQLRRVIGA